MHISINVITKSLKCAEVFINQHWNVQILLIRNANLGQYMYVIFINIFFWHAGSLVYINGLVSLKSPWSYSSVPHRPRILVIFSTKTLESITVAAWHLRLQQKEKKKEHRIVLSTYKTLLLANRFYCCCIWWLQSGVFNPTRLGLGVG